jgi:hypothetical protein
MSYARITNLLPTKSVIETTLLTAAFITVHVGAYLDREQDNESTSVMTFSMISKLVATCHTSAAVFKVWENLERAGQHINPSKYKAASGGALAASAGTLAGVWAAADSRINLVLGISNAASNFLGRVFSSAHRKAVMSELVVSFDSLIEAENNANQGMGNASGRSTPSIPQVESQQSPDATRIDMPNTEEAQDQSAYDYQRFTA